MIENNDTAHRDKETYNIIGAAMAVHQELGSGFLEIAYKKALEYEFELRNIPYKREKKFPLYYKDKKLDTFYMADFVCYGEIIVETRTLDMLSDNEETKVINYLKVSNLEKALLINFGTKSLQYRRLFFNL
jgi:GxxExxY protein